MTSGFGGFGGGGAWGGTVGSAEHVRITWSGTLGSASADGEEWACGIAVKPGTALDSLAKLQAMADAAAANFPQTFGRTRSVVTLTGVKAAALNSEGRTARMPDGQYAQGEWVGTTPSGGPAGFLYPPQVSLAVTLDTARGGIAGTGRMFLPAPHNGALGADGRMTAADQEAAAFQVRDGLRALNTALAGISAGAAVALASGGSVTKGLPAAVLPIIGVRVGRVLDTQRRRRRDLLEEYRAEAL